MNLRLKYDGLQEFLIWRKENPPCTDEEFVRKIPNVGDDLAIPTDLDSRLEKLKKKLPDLIQNYQSMCSAMDRMIKLEELRAADFTRYGASLR